MRGFYYEALGDNSDARGDSSEARSILILSRIETLRASWQKFLASFLSLRASLLFIDSLMALFESMSTYDNLCQPQTGCTSLVHRHSANLTTYFSKFLVCAAVLSDLQSDSFEYKHL